MYHIRPLRSIIQLTSGSFLQIELTRSVYGGQKGQCVFNRQKVLCCDPAFGDTSGAFLPVELDYLFPEDIPTEDAPDYAESFDYNVDQMPEDPNGIQTNDPNKNSFAWVVLVGPPGAYQ